MNIKDKIEDAYITFKMMRIARHNMERLKFEAKHKEEFEDYGIDLENMTLEKCMVVNGKLLKYDGKGNFYQVADERDMEVSRSGHIEYVDQHVGYCENVYYGTIYTKTPLKNKWLEQGYHC